MGYPALSPVENTHIPCMAKSIPRNFSACLFSAVWFSQQNNRLAKYFPDGSILTVTDFRRRPSAGSLCFQKRLRQKKQDFSEKMKKDWQGSSESYQDAYEEVIIMNCRKRKLPDVMKRYEISEGIICTNLAERLQTVMMQLQWKILI